MTSPKRSALLLVLATATLASFAACRSDDESNPRSGTGGTSGFGGGGNTGGTSNGGSSGSGNGGTAGTATGGGGSGGSSGAAATTITDVANGTIAANQDVTIPGAVVMTRQFLVSQTSSGSCLWGVFVSEPTITETAAYSGIIVLSYGDNAVTKDGGTKAFCPILSEEPTGSGIPDDIAPGDVVDIAGKASYFAAASCTGSKQRQLISATLTKTGTASLPTPHALAASDVAKLAAESDDAFHDMWGGVKVRITNVTATPQGDAGTSITDQFGHIVLSGSNLQVGDDLYYQGALKSQDACHDAPQYANASQAFVSIDGFSLLDFCTWGLQPASKCGDLDPASEDCAIGTDSATGCTHY